MVVMNTHTDSGNGGFLLAAFRVHHSGVKPGDEGKPDCRPRSGRLQAVRHVWVRLGITAGRNPSKGAACSHSVAVTASCRYCPSNLGQRREHACGDARVRGADTPRRFRESRNGEQLNDERPERACW